MIVGYACEQVATYRLRCGDDDLARYVEHVIPCCRDYLYKNRDLFTDALLGLIHTGLHPENLIASSNGTLFVIDWEHANIGDRAFEIAGLTRRASLPIAAVMDIIERYRGSDARLLERSNVYAEIFKLHEVLWHAIRADMAERDELRVRGDKSAAYFTVKYQEKLQDLRTAEYAP